MTVDAPGVQLTDPAEHADEVLTNEALGFVAQLHRSFNQRRLRLLGDRRERQARFDAGELPDFLPNTRPVRDDADWRVAPRHLTWTTVGWRSPARSSRR